MDLLETGITFDDDDRPIGFLVGKDAALADWSFRKEQSAFRKLCQKLHKRNYVLRKLEQDPVGWRRHHRERVARWREEHPEQTEEQRERARQRRRAARRPRHTYQCHECLREGRSYRPRRFCSRECSQIFHGRQKSTRRNRGQRNRQIRQNILTVLRAELWLQLRPLADRLGERHTSVATAISAMLKNGQLKHDGKRMNRRYADISQESC